MLNNLTKLTAMHIKRRGKGIGSGQGGHTSGRGNKGHKARSGKSEPLWFEGGQLPFIKRFPYLRGKFHFKTIAGCLQEVPTAKLVMLAGKDVTPETLAAAKLIKNPHWTIKLVGSGKLEKIGEVRGVKMSASARQSLEAAGAKIL